MKNYLTLAIGLLLLGSCSQKDTPSDLLNEDKMVEMLVDIHMAEGLVSSFPIHYDSARIIYPYLENEVFVKHQISDTVFYNSLQYYMRDAKMMDRLYARTIDSLIVTEKSGKQPE